MSRFTKCLNYQIKTKIKGTLIFLGFYAAIYAALFTLFSVTGGSINASLFFSATIFVFVYVIADYRSKTNYMIMLGNSRKNIFLSSILSNIVISVFLTLLSAAASSIESIISVFSVSRGNGTDMLKEIYPDSSMATVIVYIFALLVLITSVSTIYGALAYKFRKLFSIPFWVVFGMSFMLLPVPGATALFKAFFCYGIPNGMLLAPINFLVTALILYAASYAAARRQPQVV